MQVNDLMKRCIREAIDRYPEHDFVETVNEALETYATIEGPIEVEDESEGIKFVDDCIKYCIDCTLGDLINSGLVEMAGIDEKGDFTFSLSETGKNMIQG